MARLPLIERPEMTDKRDIILTATAGRDANKRFRVVELGTVDKASFALRLVSGLRVESYEALLDKLRAYEERRAAAADGEEVQAPIDDIMQLLQGCDPVRVEALIREALAGVQVAPDPKHPEAFRPATVDDLGELRTLGELLMSFGKLNFSGA